MKRHSPDIFGEEIWKEIDFIFWRETVGCLPPGAVGDGIHATELETTKRGIEIWGTIWFLLGGRPQPNPGYVLHLCLSKPRFSSIESVTVDKIQSATISESSLESDVLKITVS